MKKSNNKIQVTFGKPKHGWLPTYLKVDDFELEIEISDVPLNPMTQLCDALIEINSEIKLPIRVLWHLEPFCYYLEIEVIESFFKMTIFESDTLQSTLRNIKEFEGNFNDLILPLYRSIKKFHSYAYQTPHWEEMDSDRIERLTKLIKTKKENTK